MSIARLLSVHETVGSPTSHSMSETAVDPMDIGEDEKYGAIVPFVGSPVCTFGGEDHGSGSCHLPAICFVTRPDGIGELVESVIFSKLPNPGDGLAQ